MKLAGAKCSPSCRFVLVGFDVVRGNVRACSVLVSGSPALFSLPVTTGPCRTLFTNWSQASRKVSVTGSSGWFWAGESPSCGTRTIPRPYPSLGGISCAGSSVVCHSCASSLQKHWVRVGLPCLGSASTACSKGAVKLTCGYSQISPSEKAVLCRTGALPWRGNGSSV